MEFLTDSSPGTTDAYSMRWHPLASRAGSGKTELLHGAASESFMICRPIAKHSHSRPSSKYREQYEEARHFEMKHNENPGGSGVSEREGKNSMASSKQTWSRSGAFEQKAFYRSNQFRNERNQNR